MTLIEKVIELDGTIIERPYTKEQLAEAEKSQIEAQNKAEALAIKTAEKAALLERLGITEAEAKLLLS
jgi:hypothetical protein